MTEPFISLDRAIAAKYLRPGDVVIDAGAYTGDTALLYVELGAKHVFAFEPHPELHAELVANTLHQPCTCIRMALAHETGSMRMWVSQLHNYGSTIVKEIVSVMPLIFNADGDTPPADIIVNVVDLDTLGIRADFWKVDIEGAECAMLVGAQFTLNVFPPRVLQVEIYPPFLNDFRTLAGPHFSHARRVAIRKDTGTLAELDIDALFDESMFLPAAPTYLFYNSAEPIVGLLQAGGGVAC